MKQTSSFMSLSKSNIELWATAIRSNLPVVIIRAFHSHKPIQLSHFKVQITGKLTSHYSYT